MLAVVAVGAFVVWAFWPGGPKAAAPGRGAPASPLEGVTNVLTAATLPATLPVTAPASAPLTTGASTTTRASATRPSQPALSREDAAKAFARGMADLKAGKAMAARVPLTAAVLSGGLSAADEATAIAELTQLADLAIFSRGVQEGDAYCEYYRFKAGEVLNKVETAQRLHVPPQLILQINGLRGGGGIQAGQQIKVIKGPMHAVVSKSRFTMDIFLQRDELPPVFIRRLACGLGKDSSTPVGMWRVGLGRKLTHAPWNPPPSAGAARSIAWGQPGYPLGADGLWLGLEGIDDNTRPQTGYGIHGTNEPQTIGREGSLGCIRLADNDIRFIYDTLYESWSTVEVRP
jgi:LysM repeat protein